MNSFALMVYNWHLNPFFGVVLLAIFIFEVAMIVSAVRNKHITDNARILWIIGMLIIHPIVAIVYYFTDYKKAG